jgi:hypothetical protein
MQPHPERDRVPLHSTLQPNPRQGSARRNQEAPRLGATPIGTFD